MDPKLPVEKIPGIGEYYLRKLKKLEIKTVENLVTHFPFRYDDFSALIPISNLSDGQIVTLQGNIWSIRNLRSRTGKFLTLATLADQTGTIDIVWFNQAYITKTLKAKIASILPQYIKETGEFLPEDLIKRQKLIGLTLALSKIHFPKNLQDVEKARKRLSFDELFILQLAAGQRRRKWKEQKKASKFSVESTKLEAFLKNLPFALTTAQKRSLSEILGDLQKETPANRLLEGDVGSGKTVVAAAAAYFSHQNGYLTLLAAPTEILAHQHQKTLEELLTAHKIKVGIWTGAKKEDGDVICGTHALLISYKPKREVGLVVVDEQHRFGVAQRGKFAQESATGKSPHILTMTATPIPRTLALTLYGDRDLSVLDEIPEGRQKIQTHVVPNFKRAAAYKFIDRKS